MMTVQVYKLVQRSSKPVQRLSRRTAYSSLAAQTVVDAPLIRKVRHSYSPFQPRLDLALAIEALTHSDSPTFDELEAIINSEELGVAE